MSQDDKGEASPLLPFTIALVGDRYKDDPLDQVGCETKAASRGETYTPPTSEQFLKTAAKSLAKFEMPYQRELFLAKPKDLRVLQHEHSRPEQRQAMIQKLQKYISEEAKIADVSLRELSHDELPDNVVVPTKHAWKPDFFSGAED